MFYSARTEEIPIPMELVPPGTKAWRSIELGLYVPVFLVAFTVKDGELEQGRHFFLTELRDVIEICKHDRGPIHVTSVCALLPGYMTGLEAYSLHRLAEVWESADDPFDQLFVSENGERFFSLGYDESKKKDRTCTIKLSKLKASRGAGGETGSQKKC